MANELLHSAADTAATVLDRLGFLRSRFIRNGALRVLCYHGVCADADVGAPWVPSYFVSASRFAEHLALLQRFGRVVPVAEYLSQSDGRRDEACIAITFDDVAACTMQHALPVLDAYGMRASFYVSTGHARSGHLFAADVLHLIRSQPELVSAGVLRALAALIRDPARHKLMTLDAQQTLLAEAEAMVRRRADRRIVDALRCVNWGEVRLLAARGHEIGGHTVDHAILGKQSAGVRREQIAGCRDDLVREIGSQPLGFAFPNGGPGDFDETDATLLREHGFSYALTTQPGPVTRESDRFALPRSGIGQGHSAGMLAVELSGMLDGRRRRQSGWDAPEQAAKPRPPVSGQSGTPIDDPRESASMRREEYAVLDRLLAMCNPVRTLEIGMANGGSTLRICAHLQAHSGGLHTAVDPYQFATDGWAGRGAARVERAGLAAHLEVIARPDYLALPELVARDCRFDFILIDGWHAFDFTQLDLFYADLLLRPNGVLAIHDTNWPAVYRACRFLETHKPYERIGPPLHVTYASLAARVGRRVGQVIRGPAAMRAARARRHEWFALAAYRKTADHQVPNDYYASF